MLRKLSDLAKRRGVSGQPLTRSGSRSTGARARRLGPEEERGPAGEGPEAGGEAAAPEEGAAGGGGAGGGGGRRGGGVGGGRREARRSGPRGPATGPAGRRGPGGGGDDVARSGWPGGAADVVRPERTRPAQRGGRGLGFVCDFVFRERWSFIGRGS